MRGECIQWRDVSVAVAAKLEVRISPVLRPPPNLGDTGFQRQAPRDPYRLHPPRPGGVGQPAREGAYRAYHRGRPQRSPRVSYPALSLPGLANTPPHAHTHPTCPQFAKGRLLGARTKAPGVWRAAASPPGAPGHAPHWLPNCASMGWGAPEQSPGGTGKSSQRQEKWGRDLAQKL